MFECANVGFLHHFFCFVVIPKDCADDSKKTLVVSAHNDFKQISLAAAHASDDLLVRDLCFVGQIFHRHTPLQSMARAKGYRCNQSMLAHSVCSETKWRI